MAPARGGFVAIALLAGCYSPSVPSGVPCDPVAPACPNGQSCRPSASGFACTADTTDAGTDDPDAAIDARPDAPAGFTCLGQGFIQECYEDANLPSGQRTLSTAIDTTVAGPGHCSRLVPQPTGPALCIVEAGRLTIGNVVVAGANLLVLIASNQLVVSGKLDVSSRVNGQLGPASRASCGNAGAGMIGNTESGGGGGAGGSFGTRGGNGGNGVEGREGGTAIEPPGAAFLVGGCPGANGGAGGGGNGAGLGGRGGGAVYLIAGDQIRIEPLGAILALGAGGKGGEDGVDSSGGGGGGGSGGFIGLDAPAILCAGTVNANGGSGGGGGGDDPAHHGDPGTESTDFSMPSIGGDGGLGGGGRGGSGYGRSLDATTGGKGAGPQCAGGGGGGGAGVIRVFQTTPNMLGGSISPPPT